MEAVAKRARVGKPTLYKWWPSKASLVLAMFGERLASQLDAPQARTAEEALRIRVRLLIQGFNGLFGKVMADLIAEGQSEGAILRDLFQQHMQPRRAAALADVEWGKATGEFRADTDAELLADSLVGPIYFRLLLRFAPLTEAYGEALVDQVLRGARAKPSPG